MSLSDVEKVSAMISCLGGPLYPASELEWAIELTAGRNVMRWLASQVDVLEDGDDEDVILRAALQDIALEDEEVQILKRLKQPVQDSDSAPSPKTASSDYLAPSRRSLHCTLLDNLAYSTETEVTQLKLRLQQTKLASQQLSRTVKTLKTELERLNGEIHEQEDGLSDLSIKMDTAISHTTQRAYELIDTLNLDPQNVAQSQSSQAGTTTAMLATMLDSRSEITENIAQQLETVTLYQQRLPASQDLRSEASRIQALLFRDHKSSSLRSLAEDSAFCGQMQEYVRLLQNLASDDGEIYDVLQQIVDAEIRHDGRALDVDIADELNMAWNTDQASVLQAKALILKTALRRFDDSVCPPLQDLHRFLSERTSFLRDTSATVGALGEEMEETNGDLQKAMQRKPVVMKADQECDFEEELRKALKELKDLRPSDLPPLVLLDQKDILDELHAVQERNQTLDIQEDRWTDSLPSALNSLQARHDTGLSATYGHSILNTTPPYHPSPNIVDLQVDAKAKRDELTSAVQTLQKGVETMESSRTQRKLRSFVDRWNAVPT